jgi:hypothetical protein
LDALDVAVAPDGVLDTADDFCRFIRVAIRPAGCADPLFQASTPFTSGDYFSGPKFPAPPLGRVWFPQLFLVLFRGVGVGFPPRNV